MLLLPFSLFAFAIKTRLQNGKITHIDELYHREHFTLLLRYSCHSSHPFKLELCRGFKENCFCSSTNKKERHTKKKKSRENIIFNFHRKFSLATLACSLCLVLDLFFMKISSSWGRHEGKGIDGWIDDETVAHNKISTSSPSYSFPVPFHRLSVYFTSTAHRRGKKKKRRKKFHERCVIADIDSALKRRKID